MVGVSMESVMVFGLGNLLKEKFGDLQAAAQRFADKETASAIWPASSLAYT